MPRKEWIPRNPYCKKSKLTESDFKTLSFYYFTEVIFGYTRKDCYILFCDKHSEDTESLSHQAFGRYFEKISQYIWDRFVVDLHPSFLEEDVFDDLLGMLYGNIDKISSYKELYNSLDDFPLYINADNIAGSLMFYLLQKRSKVIRGFKKEKFYLEFSRVYFLCSAIKKMQLPLKSIYAATDRDKIAKICWASSRYLLNFLKKNPM